MNARVHALLAVAAAAALASPARAQLHELRRTAGQPELITAAQSLDALRAALAEGRIRDPRLRALPPLAPPTYGAAGGGSPCLSPAHVYPYEDTNQLLLSNFTTGELIDLMVEAANDLMTTHGDVYDFAGFWVNFTPHHLIGAAFYMQIENDVQGIGDALYDNRPNIGLAGDNIEGFVMMWDVNASHWQPGDQPGADFTRLALAQEFEHRFAMFLPDLLDGRQLQGDNASCGRVAHWNWKVDGQGSGMELSEWVGSNPAVLTQSFVSFNTDTGGVFGHSDLYLMGYDSPAEMDAGNSELRYMNDSNCSSNYFGVITPFSSADVVAAAGPRIPDSTTAQKHFRTGWIMLHQPGAPPTQGQLDKCVGILEQHQTDWAFSTLDRGTMNDSLFDDCNCNDVPDADDVAGGSLDLDGDGVPDECQFLGELYCDPAVPNSTGSPAGILAIGSAMVSDNDLQLGSWQLPPNQFGYFLASQTQGFVANPGGSQGNLCLGGTIGRFAKLVQSSGPDGKFAIAVDLTDLPGPLTAVMPGETWSFQAWYRDTNPGPTSNFSPGLSILFF